MDVMRRDVYIPPNSVTRVSVSCLLPQTPDLTRQSRLSWAYPILSIRLLPTLASLDLLTPEDIPKP